MARRLETQPAEQERLIDVTPGDLPILLVDDRPDNLRTLETILSPLGFELLTATSGQEALRLLLERDVALILLDVRMPGLDGIETARMIKSRPRTRDVPVVFITASRDEIQDIVRGYGIGAVDYVLKPFDPALLRSKVAVFTELEMSRRALKHSEAFLRGAFEAAPVGKTVLDGERRIAHSNPAFARLVGRDADELHCVPVADLCHPDDLERLSATLDYVAHGNDGYEDGQQPSVDLRLVTSSGSEVWVGLVASSIEPTELEGPLLLAQWVDLTVRRRAEQDRAELLLEQAARAQAEEIAARLGKLQALTSALQSVSLDDLLPELAARLAEMFDAQVAEVTVTGDPDEPRVFRAETPGARAAENPGARAAETPGARAAETPGARAAENPGAPAADPDDPGLESGDWRDVPLAIEHTTFGEVRLQLPPGRRFGPADSSLLREAADRAALSIRRAQLHQEEHRIAVELQRGLIPKRLPRVPGVELAAHYEVAGIRTAVGGDWYDVFPFPEGRLGVVLGDVAGRGIRAAATMVQLRSVSRAFALADEGRDPGAVLTRLNRYQLALADDELVTVIYAIVDPEAGALAWASAGHPPPLLRRRDGETAFLDGGDALIGIEDTAYRTLREAITHGETLAFYTDGLVERRGESLDTGLERLAQAVASGPQQPQALCEHVLDHLLDSDRELHDDVTTVIVEVS